MAQLLLFSSMFTLLRIVAFGFEESLDLHVILGNSVTFSKTNCSTGKLHRAEADALQLVAERADGVCTPSEAYKDRVDPNGCFALTRSVYTDNGVFELTCVGKPIQLDVVVAFNASVREGEPVKLECHIKPHEHLEHIRWKRNGTVVLQYNLFSKETAYGTGFEGRVRLAPDCYAHGDWSLIWDQALLEDEGDYFCAAYNKGERSEWGHPAAGRLKVRPDQTSLWIISGVCSGVGLFCVACLFVWYLKSRRSGSASLRRRKVEFKTLNEGVRLTCCL